MHYEYFKSRPLNDLENRRLQISAEIDRQLFPRPGSGDESDPLAVSITENSCARLIREITGFLTLSHTGISRSAIDWLLCYSSKETLQRLIHVLDIGIRVPTKLKLFSNADPTRVLEHEQISPDLQVCQLVDKPKTALVCFSGNNQRLNIPVQLFHSLVGKSFDVMVYLRDDRRERFIQGIPGLAPSIETLGDVIRNKIPTNCHIAIVSTSSGGLAACRTAELLSADRVALFSPIFGSADQLAISSSGKLAAKNMRSYFANDHNMDRRLAKMWKSTHLSSSVRMIESHSHGTLWQQVVSGQFESILSWLAGR